MIEVFKTNIEDLPTAQRVSTRLNAQFPDYHLAFDLDDCDHILRVASKAGVKVNAVIQTVERCNVEIAVLED